MKTMRHPYRVLAQITAFAMVMNMIPLTVERAEAAETWPLCSKAEKRSFGFDIMNSDVLADSSKSNRGNAARNDYRKRFVEDWRKRILEENSKLHNYYYKNGAGGKPGLNLSREARSQFFFASFGKIPELCDYKMKMSAGVNQFASAPKEALADVNNVSCEGSAKELLKTYKMAKDSYKVYERETSSLLNGTPPTVPKEQYYRGLEKYFTQDKEDNRKEIAAFKAEPVQLHALKEEHEALWEANGFYQKFMEQLRKEVADAKSNIRELDANKDKLEALEKRCGSWGAANPAVGNGTGASKSESTVTEAECKALGTCKSGLDTSTSPPAPLPGAESAKADAAAVQAKADLDAANAKTEAAEKKAADLQAQIDEKANAEQQKADAAAEAERLKAEQLKNKTKGSSGSFLADNWGWIVGGAAVGGLGYLGYKEIKKDEKEKDKWKDKNFAKKHGIGPYASDTSTSTDTSTSATAPAGAKLIVTSAVNPPTVGQPMSTLEVVLVNAEGVEQPVNGLAVQVSCLTPSPCSITGPQSVTTVNGHASFPDLIFNQADQDVQLQFMAPGVEWVTTTGKFNVQGNAARE